MTDTKEIRNKIASKVRELRLSRSWSQVELAHRLGISQNWLSELERGVGSFTAEQFLLVLQLFNVAASDFAPPAPRALDLQNSLVRFGASHLQKSSQAFPSSELEDIHRVILEALVDAGPRVLTAIGPVLVSNADKINLWKLAQSLSALGLERRLAWVIDNTVQAIEVLKNKEPSSASAYSRAELPLKLFMAKALDLPRTVAIDVLDRPVRSQKTLDELQRNASPASERWGIVTAVQLVDFVEALEAVDERR